MQEPGSASLRKNTSLTIFLLVRVIATFTYQMITVAFGWQIYALTRSAFILGLVGLIQFIPMVLFTLVVGYVADHFNRKRVICISQAVLAVCCLLLAAGSAGGWIHENVILIMVFFIGAANAFQAPCMQALLPNIVERGQFARATAAVSSAAQAATILGPALGGLLYAAGAVFVYGLAGLCTLAMAALILFVSAAQTPAAAETAAPAVREPVTAKSLFSGISFIKSRPVILGAISLDLFAVLFGGATALLPIYAATILKTGAWGLGLLRCAPAVGAAAMSLLLSRRPIQHRVGRRMFAAVLCFGLATIGFALSTSFLLSFALLIVLGAADVISVVIRSTLVQMETPDEMRGRVSSVNMLFIGTSNQLGEFESGLTASWFGAMPAAVIGGVGTIAVVGLWSLLFPPLFKANTFSGTRGGAA